MTITFSSTLIGGLIGSTLGFASKDLELDFQDAFSEKENSTHSFCYDILPQALKDKAFWQISILGLASGLIIGASLSKIQDLSREIFN